MAMSNEVQLLNNITSEVDESQLRIFFSIQCSKAQAILLDRLKKKIKEAKAILNFTIVGNKKLEVEIKLAEQELNNLIIAHSTINSGNIETRKQLLLKIDEKVLLSKKIEDSITKYEELWLSSTSKFKNIPLVQQCSEGKKKVQLIENNINNLRKQCVTLSNEIKMKKRAVQALTRVQVIDLAQFLVYDRPKTIKMIQERINEIQDLTMKIKNVQLPIMDSRYTKVKIIELDDNLDPKKATQEKKKFVNHDNAVLMPKLQLMDVDMDTLGVTFNQIKKNDLNLTPPVENKMNSLRYNMDSAHSSNTFNEWGSNCEPNKSYSDRKLINIIGDITLKGSQTRSILSKVDTNTLKNVNTIGSRKAIELLKISPLPEEKVSQPLKEIEEKVDDIEEQNVQSSAQTFDRKKKKVSFDLSLENVLSEITETQNNKDVNAGDGKNNETSNINVSMESDEGNKTSKDKIVMAHKLDATPEFVYSKHFISNKITENKIVSSKFFEPNKVSEPSVVTAQTVEQDTKIQDIQESNFTKPLNIDMYKNKRFDETNTKMNQDVQKSKYQLSGLLFEHGGSQVISELLDQSLNATGLDCDDSYPQCLDSSVLLSPKADTAMDGTDNTAVMPQVPNFMSGLRKTGTSFFERLTDDNKPNSSTTNTEGHFNFNFSGEEKKKGAGFFNMFFNK